MLGSAGGYAAPLPCPAGPPWIPPTHLEWDSNGRNAMSLNSLHIPVVELPTRQGPSRCRQWRRPAAAIAAGSRPQHAPGRGGGAGDGAAPLAPAERAVANAGAKPSLHGQRAWGGAGLPPPPASRGARKWAGPATGQLGGAHHLSQTPPPRLPAVRLQRWARRGPPRACTARPRRRLPLRPPPAGGQRAWRVGRGRARAAHQPRRQEAGGASSSGVRITWESPAGAWTF